MRASLGGLGVFTLTPLTLVKASEVTQAARDEELRILIELIAQEVTRDSDRLKGLEDEGMQLDPPSPSLDMLTTLDESCIVQFLLAGTLIGL